ncbi:uncharacterized protein E0L32_001876 [Thyridium curvatum]|uniref:Nuclear pore complex component n=1 Tax=Thyridium curvatum TaxID=1093900 RepID=A0A507ATN3_9PEZI|nr:uncharacterized protein E0L32_001803 [Thyridium curvatum]XP_030990012.1 uncharacterized protein E0L32_001876 [Thyridium curvatum]TPX08228.1 hypothetical protein E0L32_001803 [Thyridium curvatum]TPX08301.1 hypothetical protein E0L32_001876 [Thyridium curvatum]
MSSTALVPPKSASTPTKKTPVIADSPGNWRHPRLAEITKRQNATVFSERNVRAIVYNLSFLVIVVAIQTFATSYGLLRLFGQDFRQNYESWLWLTLQCIPVVNIALALLPLVRRQDDLSDIPLTPSQRKLLGLPPSSAPATPGSVYSTPPRYSRTPSLSGSIGSNKSYTSSPLSGRGSPGPSSSRINGSPFSPVASPLFQKAVNGPRRSSFGSPSPLPPSSSGGLFPDAPGTPSPSGTGKRSSVGLNNKWLYERGRKGSGSGSRF